MAEIEKVKQLRSQTGVSVGAIRKALDEAEGDSEKAIEILRARGAHVAEKKASRGTSAGVIVSYIHGEGKVGVLVELLCETDFVARNDQFRDLAHDLAMQIVATAPSDQDELLTLPFVKDESKTVKDRIDETIAALGENIKIGRFSRMEL